ncbi:MAG: hypothetical protein IH831_01825, partial [Planctomycetes bacterium]|nr:hypothetical protein [Planctomycetota bacterium]
MPKYTRGYRAQCLPTMRELETLSWAARGLGNKEIAFKLGVEVTTGRGHMDSVNR